MSLVRVIISAFNSNFVLMLCVSRKRFYINIDPPWCHINIDPPWCHKIYVLYLLYNNLNIAIKNKKFQIAFAVKNM